MPYEVILFDLGGVLVEWEADRLLHMVAQRVGKPFEAVQEAVYDPAILLPFELGRISPREYYEALTARLRFSWTFAQFTRGWNDMIREKPGMTRQLPALRDQCRLAALSNTNVLHLAHLKERVPALGILEDWIASCEVGLRKPDPAIYRAALDRMGVLAEAAVYVDDRPELAEAGRRVGLSAIRFETEEQCLRDLRALGFHL